MMEDSVRVDAGLAQAVDFRRARNQRNLAAARQNRASDEQFQHKVIALADRLYPRLHNQTVLDLLPVAADDAWVRRVSGLRKLGAPGRRSLRPLRAANDRGRKNGLDNQVTLPLNILTAAVFAFGVGLAMAGITTLVTRSSLMMGATAFLN